VCVRERDGGKERKHERKRERVGQFACLLGWIGAMGWLRLVSSLKL